MSTTDQSRTHITGSTTHTNASPGGLLLVLLPALLLLAACAEGEPDPQEIIDRARAVHGSEVLDQAVVEFDFRGKHFTVRQEDGVFSYARTYTDSTGARVREVLDNEGLSRTMDGERVSLSDEQVRSLETAVNSVVYFALLPHALNDPAVQKRYAGDARLNGEPYHKVEVTFRREGGGRDYEDRFMYWIHKEDYTIDYLAYHFHTGEGGTRFREAVNPRTIEGVRFADYLNFTSDTLGTAIERYGEVMEAGGLRKVSEVVLENVQVRPLER